MPRYWLISDRNNKGTGTGINNNGLSYFVSDVDPAVPLDQIGNWTSTSPASFRTQLATAADAFPSLPDAQNEDQSHVTIFIHGFNVSFASAASAYQNLCNRLFTGPASMGLCILYDWPSLGSVAGYLPDRATARQCAGDLTDILSELFDWLLGKQQDAVVAAQAAVSGKATTATPCKAKVSIITHSMGNYVLQNAMAAAWTRKNQPLLVSLVNQLIMVAADVDNDLFDTGAPDNTSGGSAMANLTYRITSLYSGRDAVLGASSGLKHFGARRLGRSGLAHRPPLVSGPPQTDNVWDVDCSSFFPASVSGMDIHGAYFVTEGTINLMRQVLRGIDRGVLDTTGVTAGSAWPPKA